MEQTHWSPRPAGIAAGAVVGLFLTAAAVLLVTDLPGRFLGGVAGIGLLVFAAGSWRARPRLAIADGGLAVRGWWREQLLGPADIERIRITEIRRIGRIVRLLEIETTDDRLIVLSRWDLGTDPLQVLDALTDAGYAG